MLTSLGLVLHYPDLGTYLCVLASYAIGLQNSYCQR